MQLPKWLWPLIASGAGFLAVISLRFAINSQIEVVQIKADAAALRVEIAQLKASHERDDAQDLETKRLAEQIGRAFRYAAFLDKQVYRLIEHDGISFPDRPDLSN